MFNFLKKLFGRGKPAEQEFPTPEPVTAAPVKMLDLNIPDEALHDEVRFAAYLQERLPFFGD